MSGPNDSVLFSKPLIIGASVSADWASLSPGKRLAHRHVDKPQVKVIARGGQTGASVLGLVNSKDLEDRSIIIGLDLFFWDSARGNLESAFKKLQFLVSEAERLKIPLLIGDIPELAPGFQPLRDALNERLRLLQAASPVVRIIPLERLYVQILRDGHLDIRGRRYTFFDLVPDGLHIGDVASDFLADVVYETVRPSESSSEVTA